MNWKYAPQGGTNSNMWAAAFQGLAGIPGAMHQGKFDEQQYETEALRQALAQSADQRAWSQEGREQINVLNQAAEGLQGKPAPEGFFSGFPDPWRKYWEPDEEGIVPNRTSPKDQSYIDNLSAQGQSMLAKILERAALVPNEAAQNMMGRGGGASAEEAALFGLDPLGLALLNLAIKSTPDSPFNQGERMRLIQEFIQKFPDVRRTIEETLTNSALQSQGRRIPLQGGQQPPPQGGPPYGQPIPAPQPPSQPAQQYRKPGYLGGW